MESPGKCLKAERERRNLSLEEAAKFTKIREQYLRAIEVERYELLPPGVYIKGFLAAYARYLGLDPNDVVLRYQKYLEDLSISKQNQVELPLQIPPSKKRVRLWLFLVPIFAIIFFIFFYYIPHEHMDWLLPSFEEDVSTSIPLSDQEKVGTQATHQAEQREVSKPKEVEVEDTITTGSPSFEVLEASMGTGIEREGGRIILRGKSSEFTCNNQRAYFFTRIKTQKEEKIDHVWLWKGKEFHRIEIEVKSPAWSVYSYLTLRQGYVGSWKAEVRYKDNILTSLSFNVT